MTSSGALATRWRTYEEERAHDGRLLRVLGGLAPARPRRADVKTEAPTRPARRTTVSVVIPCFNYGRFLEQAVDSALAQPGVDVEVIVVDDCSSDDSREVAGRLADSHPEVRLLVNEVNSGHVRSFNRGWRESSGELVVKLDADDLLTPGSLSRAAALFEAFPAVGLVYGHPRHFSREEPPEPRVGDVRWVVWDGRDWLAERCRLGVSAITNPEMVLRSSLLRRSGPMDPDVPYAPDMELSLRIAALSDVGRVLGADQALHREHASSMSETDGSGTLVDLRARAAAFSRALAALDPPRADLDETARRALAVDALRHASSARDRATEPSPTPDLLAFARETCPEAVTERVVRSLARSSPGRPARLGRKIARKLRHEVYFARWMVDGV